MRFTAPRTLALVAAAVLTVTGVATVSAFQEAPPAGCVVIQWPDGAVTTVDGQSLPDGTNLSVDGASQSSWSSSSSTSTSTTCMNGECTTTTSHLECNEDGCW
jgi:hypothetical protein